MNDMNVINRLDITLITDEARFLGTSICSSSSESSSELISKSCGFRNVQPCSTNFKFDNWYVRVLILAATIDKTKTKFLSCYYHLKLSNNI